jgi:hypothetical protein
MKQRVVEQANELVTAVKLDDAVTTSPRGTRSPAASARWR